MDPQGTNNLQRTKDPQGTKDHQQTKDPQVFSVSTFMAWHLHCTYSLQWGIITKKDAGFNAHFSGFMKSYKIIVIIYVFY